MEPRAELFRYNARANCRVLDVCDALPVKSLSAEQPEMVGPTLATVAHLIGVEFDYLRLIEGRETARQQFEALDAARQTCLATDDAYVREVEGLTDADLARPFRMPGLRRDLTVRRAPIGVAFHSTEHRADLAAASTRHGGAPPPLD